MSSTRERGRSARLCQPWWRPARCVSGSGPAARRVRAGHSRFDRWRFRFVAAPRVRARFAAGRGGAIRIDDAGVEPVDVDECSVTTAKSFPQDGPPLAGARNLSVDLPPVALGVGGHPHRQWRNDNIWHGSPAANSRGDVPLHRWKSRAKVLWASRVSPRARRAIFSILHIRVQPR